MAGGGFQGRKGLKEKTRGSGRNGVFYAPSQGSHPKDKGKKKEKNAFKMGNNLAPKSMSEAGRFLLSF